MCGGGACKVSSDRSPWYIVCILQHGSRIVHTLAECVGCDVLQHLALSVKQVAMCRLAPCHTTLVMSVSMHFLFPTGSEQAVQRAVCT
jgi:hypothetical protein